jgi:hypothetical protein
MSDFDMTVAPATIGELRRRLEALGQPWTVPGRYSDDDPLPDPPRGGQPTQAGHVSAVPAIQSAAEFEAHLRSVPPTNPFMVEHWRELGRLPADTGGGDPRGSAARRAIDVWGVG